MMLILILYAIASVMLLLGAGALVISAFRSAIKPDRFRAERKTPLENSLDELFKTEPVGLEGIELPDVGEWTSSLPRQQIVAILERQFHNSPSHQAD